MQEFLLMCRPLREALEAAFDEFSEDGDYMKARCCGHGVQYRAGVFGTDFAYCEQCKSEIRMVLSPHVSPILLGEHVTHMPTDELIAAVGDKTWWVKKLMEDDATD